MTTAQRSPELPDVPTVADTVPMATRRAPFFGFGVPHGTPKEIVDLLNKEVNLALKDPEMLEEAQEARRGTPIPGSAAPISANSWLTRPPSGKRWWQRRQSLDRVSGALKRMTGRKRRGSAQPSLARPRRHALVRPPLAAAPDRL